MQPHFFPAFSYFELLSRSKKFVFLTKVQLSRQSYQTRNRIISNKKVQWINCSVARPNGSESKLICNAKFSNSIWKDKLSKTFKLNYTKAQHKSCVQDIISFLEDWQGTSLCKFNIDLISLVLDKLGVTTQTILDSELDLPDNRSLRIIELMKNNPDLIYLYPHGSEEYMKSDNLFSKNFKCEVFNYQPLKFETEICRLSFIEVAAEYGWENFKHMLEARNENNKFTI